MRLRALMQIALFEAHLALEAGEIPVGALVVQGENIIAQDHNRREQLADPMAHAEMLVVRAAAKALGRWRLGDCILVSTLEPCTMCTAALYQSRVRQVVYAADDPVVGALGPGRALELHYPVGSMQVIAGILEEESKELLDRFFESRR